MPLFYHIERLQPPHKVRMSRKREPPVAGLHPCLLQRSRPNGSRIVASPDGAEALSLSCCLNATPSQGRARWAGRSGAGALVLALIYRR